MRCSEKHNGRQDETNACNYGAIWIASFKAVQERKQAWLLLPQTLGSPGQTLRRIRNWGNEERWRFPMKGHCFELECINSCCHYAWLFGLGGARRFIKKAYSHVQYINICEAAQDACQIHRELWNKKVINILYSLIVNLNVVYMWKSRMWILNRCWFRQITDVKPATGLAPIKVSFELNQRLNLFVFNAFMQFI